MPAPFLRRSAPLRALLVAAMVLGLVLGDVVLDRPDPAVAEAPPDDVLPAVVAAYGDEGVLGVVVARQHRRVTGASIRALDARAAWVADLWAANEAAERPFPTASLAKLFVAEDLLHRARTGRRALGDGDRALMREMIRRSDDPAASELWVRHDGARAVRDVARRYGLSATTPPAVRGQWGETMTTAADLARFLTLLPVVAHPDDAATLMGWMRQATPTAADGFDQRFGLFGADGGEVAVKQGWMCCVSGNRHVHSVGVVGGTVLVLLSEVPRTTGYDAARQALTAAAAPLPAAMRP